MCDHPMRMHQIVPGEEYLSHEIDLIPPIVNEGFKAKIIEAVDMWHPSVRIKCPFAVFQDHVTTEIRKFETYLLRRFKKRSMVRQTEI